MRRGAIFITTEADNFICIFTDTFEATMAALEMQAVLKQYGESLSKERDHFKVKLNGVGVHCGKGVMIDSLGILHGDVFNKAYHIGEDLCADGCVMITSAVKDKVYNHENFKNATYSQYPYKEGDEKNTMDIFTVVGSILGK